MTKRPQTLKTLLEYPAYREYFRRVPPPFAHSTPQFAVVAVTKDNRRGMTTRDTFKEAWVKGRSLLSNNSHIVDIDIFCRNRVHPIPKALANELCLPAEDWCGRCRRPSLFQIYSSSHPALRDVSVIVENQRRCFFCGINFHMRHGI